MADDDGEVDLSDLTIERLWQAAKKHTADPAELIEIVVLATAGGVGNVELAAMIEAAADARSMIGVEMPESGIRNPGDGILGRI